MMRYQTVSPDYLPLSNGRKSNLRTCKEENEENERLSSFNSSEGKPLKFRSESPHSDNHETLKKQSPSHGGDVFLQWGQRKRCRGSRAENRTVADECSMHPTEMIKVNRKVGPVMNKKPLMNRTAIMPPPSSPLNSTSYSRGGNLRPCTPGRESTVSLHNWNMEDRSRVKNGNPSSNESSSSSSTQLHSLSLDKRSSPPGKTEKRGFSSRKGGTVKKKIDGSIMVQRVTINHVESTPVPLEKERGASPAAMAGGEKVNLDSFEWPRIFLSLSRKEKEDDFLAMKGTKLPQRPKKRAKNIDKTLQYCFPGMWLSDLTKGRYEVREKKCVKKQKRRGLKGMESMESESE